MLGVIADDITGGTDVSVALRRRGLRTLVFFGQPPEETNFLPPHDAVVIALKTRMLPSEEAVSLSMAALQWLQRHNMSRLYFKFCSTFDSTPHGNIGPVLDALAYALAATTVVITPSSPEHQRTQYEGYLFVADLLLSESHMRNHPLTPMTDSHLPRLLSTQTRHTIGLIRHGQVRAGAVEVEGAVAEARRKGIRYIFADAVDEEDLKTLGKVAAGLPLSAGAAGLASGLAAAISANTGLEPIQVNAGPPSHGRAAVLSGSCSARTLEQIAVMEEHGRPSYRLDALSDQNPVTLANNALSWIDGLSIEDAPLIYSSLDPEGLREVQETLGVDQSAHILEQATGRIAQGLVARGFTRIIAAGGETSGAVVSSLGVRGGLIGEEAARGVPWIHTTTEEPLALLLKSGNFGDPALLLSASATSSSTTGYTR